nr:copia protein [Tanacetum cinerariifolium]
MIHGWIKGKHGQGPKIPTIGSKVPIAKPTVVVDKGNKRKAVKASARWIWIPKQTSSDQGLNFNGVLVTFKKYQYIDTQGKLKHMTGNISYLSEYEPFNGGYVSFGHGRGKITVYHKTKDVDEQSFIAIIHQKTNHALLQYHLFSCFLSQEEPKKIVDVLKDPSWVLKNKKDERGIVIRNKARLVAQGHTQEEGIDYEEVFAPIVRIEAIRLFLAYTSYMGFTVYQMDVKSAFLYGTINEEVYVIQPFGFQDPEFPHRVYKGKDGTGKDVELHLYRSMIGSLMYLTSSRSDIMFDVCACARHQVTPKECHLYDVKRIFRRLISWQCKKQTIVATSTTEAEYVAAASGCGQVLWIQNQLLDHGRITRETIRISQSKVPLPGVDETTFPSGDVRYGEAYPTDTSLDVGQDRENIIKTSTMPHEELPRVTSLGGGEGDQREDLLVVDTVKDSDKSANKGSDSTNKMSHVLGSLGATNILASRGLRSVFTTVGLSVAAASIDISPVVATASGSFPTAAIFTTASVATPTTRVTRSSRGVVIGSSSPKFVNIPSISKKDKGKGKMTEPEQPSKEEVLEQMSIQLARDLEAKFAQEDLIIREKVERDFEIARIHAERKLEVMIARLDRSNEMTAKYLSEYEQAAVGLSHDEKLESERLKRLRIQLDKERSKKLKTAEASGTEPSQEQQSEDPKELSEEELKKMIKLVPVEELYIEALHVKYPIIDLEIYSEGQRKCRKIIRVGNHSKVYQMFEDMLFDRVDLDKLWSLVKETCSTTEVIDEKAKELWVELKRLYEPDSRDPLWALQRYMHDPLVWRLYDTCGVHHVSTGRGHQIFMLVEKDYPLTKGLTTLMVSNKLQVDQYLEMANELLMKIYIIANSPR